MATRGWLAGAWLALAFLLRPSPADAVQETGLALSWQAPPDCPDEQAVLEQVRSLLAAPAGQTASLRSIRADGLVVERNGRFRLELELHDGALIDRRAFEGESCAEVTGAAAVAIALLMRPEEEGNGGKAGAASAGSGLEASGSSAATAAASPGEDATATTKTTDAGAKPAPAKAASRPPSEQESPEERQVHFVVNLWLGYTFGLFAQAGGGFAGAVGVGVEPGRWRFVVSGTARLQTQHPVLEIPETAVEIGRAAVSVAGCYWLLRGAIELAPCLTTTLQLLEAQALGPQVTASPVTSQWLALGPTALARWPIAGDEGAAITFNAGFEVQTARPVLVIEGLGTVEQVGPIEANLGVGLEYIF